jgi:alpha-beta hydrolase superfamily lysophospholipase
MSRVEGRCTGAGGVGLYWQGWLPEGAPRGLLLLCHGMGEHSGRYTTVLDALVPDGWAVYGLDHRGHGRSRGPRVHVRDYAHFLADYDTFRRLVTARHPGLRPFLLGHSMGGQIALAYALDHQDDLAGLVLSAPALAAPPVPRTVKSAARVLARVAPTLRRAVVDLTGISRDEAVVAAYRADALVHRGHPTLALSVALADRMALLAARAPELRLPLLLQHGTADRICDPAGSRELAATVGTDDLTVCWYEGFWHEVYHEPERAQPLADLREWLDARRGPRQVRQIGAAAAAAIRR